MSGEHYDHDDLVETLDEFILRRQRELGLNNRDVWRKGGIDQWSPQAVNNLVNGSTRNPGEKIIERLAIALETTPNNIRKRTGRRRHGKPFQLPPRAAGLSDGERRIMQDVMDAILGKYRENERPAAHRSRRLQPVDTAPRDLAGEREASPDVSQRAAWRDRPAEEAGDDPSL